MTKPIDKENVYKVKVEPYLELIRMWTRDGIAVGRQAKALGVSAATLTTLATVYAPLFEALRVTKEVADLSLVDCLYKRATGYTAVTHQREWVYRYNADGSVRDRRLMKEKEIEQHVPGDPRLLEYWLSHRMPDAWGQREISDQNENAGVVFLPARGSDDPSVPAAAARADDDASDGTPYPVTTGGPGGVPGENDDDRLYGSPILHISPQNPVKNTG